MTKKVTSSNTKNEILDAYNGVVDQLKQLESQKLDPAKEQASKAVAATIQKAEVTASTSIEDQVASLQKNVVGILGNLANSFSEEIKNFNNLQEAIKLKEQELKELIDIEKEAFTLAALVNTRKELAAKYDAEQQERQAEAQARLTDINTQIIQARETANAEIAKLKAEAKLEQTRQKEEFDYTFKRQKQQELDALNDQIAAQRKAHQEVVETEKAEIAQERKELNELQKSVEARETKLDELEAEVASFASREAQARAEGLEQGKKDAERTEAIKKSYADKQAASEKAIHEAEVRLLKEALESEKEKNKELTGKLDEAYGKIQNMALASVSGAQEAKAFEKLSGLISEKK